MRLIDADALKEVLGDTRDEELIFRYTEFVRMDIVGEAIDQAPTIERPHGEWIPCSERLPEESLNSVIGWDRFRERCVFVQYMDGHFQITGKQESFDIIAWMPLPEPYKEEGEAE